MAGEQDTLTMVTDLNTNTATITDGHPGDRITFSNTGDATITIAGQRQPHHLPAEVIGAAINGLVTNITVPPQIDQAHHTMTTTVPAAQGFIQNLYNQGR